MKNRNFLIIVLISATVSIVCGCSTKGTNEYAVTSIKPTSNQEASERWRLLLGSWYSEQETTDGLKRILISDKRYDGSYEDKFSYWKDGELVRQHSQVGYWGFSGDVFFTIVEGFIIDGKYERANRSNVDRYDVYHIKKLNDQEFEYHHFYTGNKFVCKRSKIVDSGNSI